MTDLRQAGGAASAADEAEVIALDLDRAVDMFETPTVHLGSDHGTFQPGIDLCVAELAGRPTGRPVQIELVLPQSEISDDLEARMTVTMRRYCDERSYTNTCHRRSTQRSGVRALRVGLPITLLGLAITAIAFHTGDGDDPQTAVVDIIGWVLAWLGLWYPFDKLIFYASDYVRENRALETLRDAQITVVPRPVDDADGTAGANVAERT
jgi:hypothetical protein